MVQALNTTPMSFEEFLDWVPDDGNRDEETRHRGGDA
jgi:Uma2 family endonuclease